MMRTTPTSYLGMRITPTRYLGQHESGLKPYVATADMGGTYGDFVLAVEEVAHRDSDMLKVLAIATKFSTEYVIFGFLTWNPAAFSADEVKSFALWQAINEHAQAYHAAGTYTLDTQGAWLSWW